eukprot:10948450-Karenia_brevis.AAC.1
MIPQLSTIEKSALNKVGVCTADIDRTKCFDRLDANFVRNLTIDLGLSGANPADFLNNMYDSASHRWKLRG